MNLIRPWGNQGESFYAQKLQRKLISQRGHCLQFSTVTLLLWVHVTADSPGRDVIRHAYTYLNA